jgi:superkiller protein 3
MALRPQDRYGSARALAADVESWLADEPVRAYREPWLARAGRWARRHKPAVAAAAAGLLVALAAGGVGAWWLGRQRAEADGAARLALAEARLLQAQAQSDPLTAAASDKAVAAARHAAEVARAGGASEEVRRQADDLLQEVQQEADAAARDRRLLAALLDVRGPHEGPKYRTDEKGFMTALAEPTADEQFAAAFRAWGLDVDKTPTAEAAALLKARPPAVVVTEVIAALDEWASQRRTDRKPEQHLADLAALLDEEPGSKRRELREIMARGRLPVERALGVLSAALRPVPIPVEVPLGRDRVRLRQLAEQTDPASEPILGLLTLTRALRAVVEEGRAEELLRAAIVARPREVVLHHTLGQMLTTQEPPHWAEAVECYGAARVARPDLGVNLAKALLNSGREHEGLALLARLVAEIPTNPYLHFQHAYALDDKGRLDEAVAEYHKAIALDTKLAVAHIGLGAILCDHKRDYDGAIACFRRAIDIDTKDAITHTNLGNALHGKGRLDEALAEHRQAIALDPKLAGARYNLGNALRAKGRLDEALAEFRQVVALDPKHAKAHSNLGAALYDKGRLDEAVDEYQKALAIDPKLAQAHHNLGNALRDKGRLDEALAEYQKAIALEPKNAVAHNGLGNALRAKRRLDEAVAEYRRAIDLDPKLAQAHYGLGLVLADKGQLDEAMDEYRQAIDLDPRDATPHTNLGNALAAKGRPDEALAEYRRAIAIEPKDAKAHYNLGVALWAKGRLDEAVAEYRQAIDLDPRDAQAHGALGVALLQQGRYAAAGNATRRALELLPADAPYRQTILRQLQQSEGMLALDRKLPAILTGEATPANAGEAASLASMCQQPYQKRYAASARLYADAFAAEPKLAADLRQQHRYNAACSAALAAAGQGEDARLLPDKVIFMFRRWALTWLRDDLKAYEGLAVQTNPAVRQAVRQRLLHWQEDSDLAGLREPATLAKLPDTERSECQKLWADVAALLKKCSAGEKK